MMLEKILLTGWLMRYIIIFQVASHEETKSQEKNLSSLIVRMGNSRRDPVRSKQNYGTPGPARHGSCHD